MCLRRARAGLVVLLFRYVDVFSSCPFFPPTNITLFSLLHFRRTLIYPEQIASALGATVISTSSSTTKLATAKQLGATHLVNYKTTPDWDQEVLRLTDGKGVDHVIEVGGAATIMKSVNCTRPGGLISVIGILSQADVMPKEFVPAVLFGAKIGECSIHNLDSGVPETSRRRGEIENDRAN
jgi:NADPH:quinone reductase-like Zn-dependent oxidoreductase